MINFFDNQTGQILIFGNNKTRLFAGDGLEIPVLNGIPRFVNGQNYADNFGFQWNIFRETQLDENLDGLKLSSERFFAQTDWNRVAMSGKSVLEVGCGAGRFSQIVLRETKANLYSIDFSNAVDANKENNITYFDQGRLILAQADIYGLPFQNNSFDYVFCFGVLQHTPDVARSVQCLIAKAKSGGEIVVDFYPIKGFWTKIHAKYFLRPFLKRLSHKRLLALIDKNVDWLILTHDFLVKMRVGILTRFLPLCNLSETLPPGISKEVRREWALLDTFDQYSPAYDQPQRINSVAKMFESNGARVTFAGFKEFRGGVSAIVRAVKL